MDDLLTRMEIKNFHRIVAIDSELANVNGFAACAQTVANILSVLHERPFVLLEDF